MPHRYGRMPVTGTATGVPGIRSSGQLPRYPEGNLSDSFAECLQRQSLWRSSGTIKFDSDLNSATEKPALHRSRPFRGIAAYGTLGSFPPLALSDLTCLKWAGQLHRLSGLQNTPHSATENLPKGYRTILPRPMYREPSTTALADNRARTFDPISALPEPNRRWLVLLGPLVLAL